MTLGKFLEPIASVTEQYSCDAFKSWQYAVAGKITTDLAEGTDE